MAYKSFKSVKSQILRFLDKSFQNNDNKSGWGRTTQTPVSIVNTGEALLTFQNLNALNSRYLTKRKDDISFFLRNRLKRELEKKDITIRYLAYAAIGLEVLDENQYKNQVREKLKEAANDSGGWPEVQNQAKSLLIPTYHAMLAMNKLGFDISEYHYEWLSSLKNHYDNLYGFSPSNNSSSFGASCLIAYLYSQKESKLSSEISILSNTLRDKLNEVFENMEDEKEDWVSYDDFTSFKIYGYGHGLYALNKFQNDLFSIDIPNFINKIVTSFENPNIAKYGPSLSCIPDRTWIPALLELAIALRAIKINFDPIKYYTHENYRSSKQLVAQKNSLKEAERKIELQRSIIEIREKSLIKEQHTALNIENLKKEIIESVSQENKEGLNHLKDIIINFLLILIPIVYIVIGFLTEENFSLFNIFSALMTLIPLLLIVANHTKEKWKEHIPGVSANK